MKQYLLCLVTIMVIGTSLSYGSSVKKEVKQQPKTTVVCNNKKSTTCKCKTCQDLQKKKVVKSKSTKKCKTACNCSTCKKKSIQKKSTKKQTVNKNTKKQTVNKTVKQPVKQTVKTDNHKK